MTTTNPPHIDDVLLSATVPGETIRVSLRGDLARKHGELDSQLRAAIRHGDREQQETLALQIEAIEAEIEETKVPFEIIFLGPRWKKMIAEHPPTDAQRERMPRLDHNPETFPYEAIAEAVVSPSGITADKARALEETMSVGEWDRLWAAVLSVNVGQRDPGESRAASVVLRRLRQSSEQPEPTESDVPSSVDAG